MSYDITVYTITTHHEANYTSNVSPMFHLAFDRIKENIQPILDQSWQNIENFKDAINCKERKITLPVLQNMILDMKAYPELYKPLNPENGWGSYEGALEFLEKGVECMRKNKDSIMEIDY